MFSKPASVLLALGCLTAAAGGAYVATRHNASETAAVAPRAEAPAQSAPVQAAAQPVAETEAAVTAPKPEPTPAEAVPAEVPPPVAARRSDPNVTPARREAPKPSARPAQAAGNGDSAGNRPAQRPAPPASTQPTAPAFDPTVVPQAAPAAPPSVPPAKPAEALRPADPPPPEPVRVPQYDEIILAASSVIGLQVESSTNTERARVEDRIDARVSRDVMSGGRVAIPAGSRMIGSVSLVERGGKVKERARLGIRFHTLVLADGTQVPLQTDAVYREGEAPAGSSTKKIGGAAIGGAILGAILGGAKGAAIGGATGAGAGTAAVMAGDRHPAALKQGEYLNVKLAAPATITVERHEQ
jgi:hypothetical protein